MPVRSMSWSLLTVRNGWLLSTRLGYLYHTGTTTDTYVLFFVTQRDSMTKWELCDSNSWTILAVLLVAIQKEGYSSTKGSREPPGAYPPYRRSLSSMGHCWASSLVQFYEDKSQVSIVTLPTLLIKWLSGIWLTERAIHWKAWGSRWYHHRKIHPSRCRTYSEHIRLEIYEVALRGSVTLIWSFKNWSLRLIKGLKD